MKNPRKISVTIKNLPISYDILLGISLRDIVKDIKSTFTDKKVFIVTDSNVARYYGRLFLNDGWNTIIIPAGEKSKNRYSKEIIENRLIENKANRESLLIALGGGMIGDLVGFTAATFMRGIPYIQIPTSLLAQVDSSIGGKTAINHPRGKNLIGAFYQPNKVYIDIKTLSTLPRREFDTGMSEVIKYATLFDRNLFRYLQNNSKQIMNLKTNYLIHVILRCIELKRGVVEKDERERNYRRILNFGHTIGHALEAYFRYKITHGKAVAIGMAAEAQISLRLGILDINNYKRLIDLITRYGLPAEIPHTANIDKLLTFTALDKKVAGNAVRYTLIESLGKARHNITIKTGRVRKILKQ